MYTKKRKHFLTVHVIDPAGMPQAAVFELSKGTYFQVLANLEAKTGLKVQHLVDELHAELLVRPVADQRHALRPLQQPYPPLYFGGSSPAGQEVAVDHCDVYLTWGEPPAQVAEKIDQVRKLAAARGRTLSFGIRLHVIVRETAEEAWREADNLIRHLDDEAIATAQKAFARFDSIGQQRMAQLHGGRRDKLEVSPNLWAGVGLVRGGAGTALVGNPEQVAARMKEYIDLGIDRFILSGYPHLEECYRFAELVFPLLPLKATTGNNLGPARNAGPFGEVIANVVAPSHRHAAQS